MPSPFLLLLPATARIAYPFILSGVRNGLSSRAIESVIRSAGLSISRGRSILPLMQKLKLIERASLGLRFIGKSKIPDVTKLPEALTVLRREYSFTVRLDGIDANGLETSQFITVATDRQNLTVGEIEQIASDAMEIHGSGQAMEIRGVTIEEGLQRVNPLIR